MFMAPRPQHLYSKLEEDDEDLPISKARRAFSINNAALLLIVAIFASGSTFLAVKVLQKPKIIPVNAATSFSTLLKLSCGNSSSEAIAAGCTFDPLTFAWTNPECPRDMVDEHLAFNKGKPWDYWVDKEGTQPLPHDDYETLSHMDDYWTTNAEHLSHCSFMLLRFHKVMGRGGERIDTLTKSFDHAHHCLMFLLQMAEAHKDYHAIRTYGRVGFDVC
jgi:hypothetical protein